MKGSIRAPIVNDDYLDGAHRGKRLGDPTQVIGDDRPEVVSRQNDGEVGLAGSHLYLILSPALFPSR